MYRIYRQIRSEVKERWIVLSEKVARVARVCGPSGIMVALTLASFLSLPGTVSALDPVALPTGGKITAGSGSIATSGSQMTVNQSTQQMIASWETFNIGQNAWVNFIQPNSSATALNRIYDQNPSQIFGSLSANGRVFLLNPSGIIFGQSARVDVGSLVASSLNMTDSDFLAGKYQFNNIGVAGSVINQGVINAMPGSVVALIAPKVINEGTITADGGSVVLAAGNQVSLDFQGDGLISYTVDRGAVDALADNKGLIKADGGLVVMTAKAADSLTRAVVNNEGILEARTLQNKAGRILLLSDMENGETVVGGRMDASAPNGGDGGFIETSGAKVTVKDGMQVTTNAPYGQTGNWLIDPYDFTVAASGGDVTGAALTTALAGTGTNVTIQTLAGSVSCTNVTCGTGTSGRNGDIFVNDNITWSANKLTLNAYRNIEINSALFGSGTAILYIVYGQGSNFGNNATFMANAPVYLSAGYNFSTKQGLLGALNAYYVITTLGDAEDATGGTNQTLQGMARTGNLSGYYALGNDIDASLTSTWNSGAGFTPIGAMGSPFLQGAFDGLGHTVTNLTINRPSNEYQGLFGYTQQSSLRNVGLVNANVTGKNYVGALVGDNDFHSSVTNAYATGTVTGTGDNVGGLVGLNAGFVSISNSHASCTVSGGSDVGGLVGFSGNATITNSYATGNVTGTGDNVGGLAGSGSGITNSYATGAVSGNENVGGLTGFGSGIADSYATGAVSGNENVGGLVGSDNGTGNGNSYYNIDAVLINGAYHVTPYGLYDAQFKAWLGNGKTLNIANYSSTLIPNGGYYEINSAQGLKDMLGFVSVPGYKFRLTANVDLKDITDLSGTQSDWHIPVFSASEFDGSGKTLTNLKVNQPFNSYIGFIGLLPTGGTLSNIALTNVSITGIGYVSGLVGYNYGKITTGSYATGTVTGTGDSAYVGGLVGYNSGTITDSYANCKVTGVNYVGGLVGLHSGGSITNTYAIGNVTGTNYVGGLVGANGYDNGDQNTSGGSIINSYATGTVTGTVTGTGNSAYVGGLVGLNSWNGTITNSYATGNVTETVTGTGYFEYVGGLAGYNYGNITTGSYATGTVTGTGNSAYVGGLVGYNEYGTITNAHATGAVSGNENVGGLVGYNSWNGTITNAYATGNVSGDGNVGGLVGQNDGTITGSYANGNVSGDGNVGGLAGQNDGTITGSYANGNVSGDGNVGGLAGDNSGGGKITNAYATGTITGTSDYASVGGLAGQNDGGTITGSHATGNVTGTSDYASVGGLAGYNSGIITSSYATGTVTVTGNSACFGGLVGQNDGTITGSYATGTVTGTGDSAYDGGLAGYNDGTISGSYATGTVTVTSDDASVGGLVGYNYGTISGSYATGTVTGTGNSAYAGGLVGANEEGSITNSYATGTVIGTGNSAYAGGLVGANGYDNGDYSAIGGNITNAYATGKVTGTGNSAYAGGLVGYKSGGSVTNSFWDKVTTGQTTSAGSAINYGKTTAELKTLATFTGAGWNIDAAGGTGKVWRIYAGYTYPLLRGFLTPATATVTGSAVSKVYDGMTVATGGTLSYMWNDPAPSDMTKIIVGLTGPYTTINKNVGNNKSIILGGLYSVQDGYDIIINPASTATVTITPLTLTGSTIVSGSSIYGASLAPGAVDFSKSNAIVGDILTATVTVNTAGQTSTSGHLTAGTHTGIESASTLNGTDAGNYTFAGVTGDYSVTPLTLTGSTIATDSSIYASDLNPGAVSFNNIVGTDKVTSTATVDVSTMSSSGKPIVGTYKQTAGAITGADAGNYSFTGFTSAKNYTINQRALTGAAIAESSSIYASDLNPGAVSFTNIFGTDKVTSTASVNTSALSTSGKPIAGSYKQTAGAITGTDAANYSFSGFTTATANYTINQRSLTGAAIAESSSIYASDLNPGAVSFTNIFGTDKVTSTASVNTSALSTSGKPIAGSYTQTAGTITGDDVGNYSFAGFTSAANYTVTPLALTGSIVTGNTVYGVNLKPGEVTFSKPNAVVSGDDVTATVTINTTGLTSTSGYLTAGTHTGIEDISVLGGKDAGNYTFAGITGDYSVTPLALTGAAIASGSSIYASDLKPGAVSFTNIVGTDKVTNTASVNTSALSTSGKPIVGSYTQTAGDIVGADAGNYSFSGYTTPTANYTINQRALTVYAAGINKLFDNTPLASVSLSDDRFGNDSLTISHASALFNDKMPGANKPVTVAGIAITGIDVGNYTLMNTTAWTTASIFAETPLQVPPMPPSAAGPSYTPPDLYATSDGITFEVIRLPMQNVPGIIVVSIPDKLAQPGSGFCFKLPEQVTSAGTVKASLPAWLDYKPYFMGFIAGNVPDGFLPATVPLATGDQRWIMEIKKADQPVAA